LEIRFRNIQSSRKMEMVLNLFLIIELSHIGYGLSSQGLCKLIFTFLNSVK